MGGTLFRRGGGGSIKTADGGRRRFPGPHEKKPLGGRPGRTRLSRHETNMRAKPLSAIQGGMYSGENAAMTLQGTPDSWRGKEKKTKEKANEKEAEEGTPGGGQVPAEKRVVVGEKKPRAENVV